MQNTTELLIKAIKYEHPEEIPIMVNFSPAAIIAHKDELRAIMKKYPDIIPEWWQSYDFEKHAPPEFRKGVITDPWGCVWTNIMDGLTAYVSGHPLPNREDILTMKVPKEDMGLPHGFMYLRLLDLRGYEEAMIDFAEECDELQILIDKVCDYNVQQMELMCAKEESPLIIVGDDLGMQQGIAIGAKKWRKYIKPALKRIFDVCKKHGKYVYMHSDGDIIEIMSDIIEAGAHLINCQYRANGIERLVETCKGKIPVLLDLDRQFFPFGAPSDMRNHLRDTVEKMYLPEGGLALFIEIGPDVPLENTLALFDEANLLRHYKGECTI